MADEAVKTDPRDTCQLEILTIGGYPVSPEPTLQASAAPWTVRVRMKHPAGNPIDYLTWLIAGSHAYSAVAPPEAAEENNTDWVEYDLDPPMTADDVNNTNGRTNISVDAFPLNQSTTDPGHDLKYFSVEGFE